LMGLPAIGKVALKLTVAKLGEIAPKSNKPVITGATKSLLVTFPMISKSVINLSINFFNNYL
jgi:hypothetical protein